MLRFSATALLCLVVVKTAWFTWARTDAERLLKGEEHGFGGRK